MTTENPFFLALTLILSADKDLFEIVGLSVTVSGLSASLALITGVPLGALIAHAAFLPETASS